ncbi:MAG: universal stress protein [Pseudomonadota bacterium]
MAFRNLLLAFSGDAAFESSLAHAIKLAHHHDAWLTAVMRNGTSAVDRYGAGLPRALKEQVRQVEAEDVAVTKAMFERETHAAGLAGRAMFIAPEALGDMAPSALARAFDLIVTGFQQDAPGDDPHAAHPDLLALRSGRPVLVVPKDYTADALSNHVLLAWDGKRAAARALGDAMDVIEGKRAVTVLTVGGEPPPTPPGGGVLTHLERHGIAAKHLHEALDHRGIAAIIEDTADAVGAKLIVMGAYEHSKFTQDMFGGVTHKVMRTARVPVFLSH